MKFRKETYHMYSLRWRLSTDFSVHYQEYHANAEVYGTEKPNQFQKRKIATASTSIRRNIGRERINEPNSKWRTDENTGTHESCVSSRMLGRDTVPFSNDDGDGNDNAAKQ